MIMSIKRFLLKPAVKKERRQTVRYVRNLSHVKDQKILVSREKEKLGWTVDLIRFGRIANYTVVVQNMGA